MTKKTIDQIDYNLPAGTKLILVNASDSTFRNWGTNFELVEEYTRERQIVNVRPLDVWKSGNSQIGFFYDWRFALADEKDKEDNPGYHINKIAKGELGEISKIREELEELEDAVGQDARIMQLIELADMYGAMEAYLKKHHEDFDMDDLKNMSKITVRAFENGHRS